jgi:hypothetical protein
MIDNRPSHFFGISAISQLPGIIIEDCKALLTGKFRDIPVERINKKLPQGSRHIFIWNAWNSSHPPELFRYHLIGCRLRKKVAEKGYLKYGLFDMNKMNSEII